MVKQMASSLTTTGHHPSSPIPVPSSACHGLPRAQKTKAARSSALRRCLPTAAQMQISATRRWSRWSIALTPAVQTGEESGLTLRMLQNTRRCGSPGPRASAGAGEHPSRRRPSPQCGAGGAAAELEAREGPVGARAAAGRQGQSGARHRQGPPAPRRRHSPQLAGHRRSSRGGAARAIRAARRSQEP